MPRPNKPWYRTDRQRWFVTIDGRWHNLGEHPQGAPKPVKKNGHWSVPKKIMEKFHRLMVAEPATIASSDDLVAVVLDAFLSWCYENRAERTADRYKDFCQNFLNHCGKLKIAQLDASHVSAWLDDRSTWNSTTKRNAIIAVSRALNWAVRNRGLKYNPIKGMEKPTPKTRTTVVTHGEFEGIIKNYDDGDPFRDLLIVSYDCGCRPFEINDLEARHVQLEKQRAVIPAEEAKSGIQRAIYFPTERSLEIVRRLVEERPVGNLFVNTRGTPWNGFSIRCRFQRLHQSGKVSRRYSHYAMRHSFITSKLVAGVDSHVVAKLAGHQNTAMLDRVYSHVADDYQFMLEQAKKQPTSNEDASASPPSHSPRGSSSRFV